MKTTHANRWLAATFFLAQLSGFSANAAEMMRNGDSFQQGESQDEGHDGFIGYGDESDGAEPDGVATAASRETSRRRPASTQFASEIDMVETRIEQESSPIMRVGQFQYRFIGNAIQQYLVAEKILAEILEGPASVREDDEKQPRNASAEDLLEELVEGYLINQGTMTHKRTLVRFLADIVKEDRERLLPYFRGLITRYKRDARFTVAVVNALDILNEAGGFEGEELKDYEDVQGDFERLTLEFLSHKELTRKEKEGLQQQIGTLEESKREKNEELTYLQGIIRINEATISNLNGKINDKNSEITRMAEIIEDKNCRIGGLANDVRCEARQKEFANYKVSCLEGRKIHLNIRWNNGRTMSIKKPGYVCIKNIDTWGAVDYICAIIE